MHCLAENGDPEAHDAVQVERVVDTTGAGDCFTAAYTVAYVRGLNVSEALKYASAAAALCIQQMGAMSSMPCDSDVQQLLKAQDVQQ
jgi:ribokinase